MKLVRKVLLIPLLVVVIAALTYLILNYVTESSPHQDLSEAEIEGEQNLEIQDLIEEEQSKIEKRLDSSIDLKSEEEFQLEFDDIDKQQWQINLNQQEELEFDSGEILTEDIEQDHEEIRDEQSAQVESDQSNEELEQQKLDNDVEKKTFVGVKGGYVAIYKGDILGDKELVEVREDISIEHLSEEDVKSLQAGLEIENEEELLGILEGFASARD
ncbi:BofC C-terminal domain-containing protein [Natroniella sp. ANB-PHB2]|uniref:BofC C-terminal domain-containing protein n=1 Tax=Natroniella sp. ANB-PHB2 TaxID=3384444 RepID=UPI0038D41CB2